MATIHYIELLHDSLQRAVKKDIIQHWTIDDRSVVFVHRRGDAVSVPVLEAGTYLNELYHKHECTGAS